MRSNYKKLGQFIQQVKNKNNDNSLTVEHLRGINITKEFMPSVANVTGTDLSVYKVVEKNQFAYNPMHVGRDEILPISMLMHEDSVIVSPAYVVFEIVDTNELLPEYLMMWCRRSEFDRNVWFTTDNSVRGGFNWEDFCDLELPIPSIEKQKEIVKEYHTIVDRIKLNEQLNQKLEDTAQSIYKEWFVNFKFPETTKLDEYIEFNPKYTIKKEKLTSYVEMADLQEDKMSLKNIIKRPYTSGSKFKNNDVLLARITPCLENGKTAFVRGLGEKEIAFGSTEFIVMQSKNKVSPYWTYCLARDKDFRSYAISSMVGSSGRQRVHSDYLKEYEISINKDKLQDFHNIAQPIFDMVYLKSKENQKLLNLKEILLSKISTIEG